MGIAGAHALTADYPEDDWQRVFDINVHGVWRCMKAELPPMVERGQGVIINLASVAGLFALYNNVAYSAAKHAVVGLTKTAAVEYGRQGIRVNAICPAYTRTPMIADSFAQTPELEHRLGDINPIGGLAVPEEIADAILYLCSESGSFINGHMMVLDGGLTAQCVPAHLNIGKRRWTMDDGRWTIIGMFNRTRL